MGAKAKYRLPGDNLDTTVYRDVKETCITWDKRVHRGNTYSVYTQNAIKEALDMVGMSQELPERRKRRPKEESIFAMGLPEPERVPVDLTSNLVAKEEVIEMAAVEAQTDEFLPEPPPEQFLPQKTGVNVATQVEDGELFDFNWEVEPILDVLVNKTLEQAVMEVEEEFEIAEMQQAKEEWLDRQGLLMKDWEAQVQEEWVRWEEKERVVKQKQLEKVREAQVLLKIQAVAAAKAHLTRLVPNAIGSLKQAAFPDANELAIDKLFLPQLMRSVAAEVQGRRDAQRLVDDVVCGAVASQAQAYAAAVAAHTGRREDIGRERFEQAQIRHGVLRLYVPDADGSKRVVGPIEIQAPGDEVSGIELRIFDWMKENDPDLAARFQWGVQLFIGEEAVTETISLFESSLGQVSLKERPAPPAAPGSPGDADQDGDQDAQQADNG